MDAVARLTGDQFAALAICLSVTLATAVRSATAAKRNVGLIAGVAALALIFFPGAFLPMVLPWQALPTAETLELLAPESLGHMRRGVNPPGGPGEGQPWKQAMHIDLVVVSDRDQFCAESVMRILSGRRMLRACVRVPAEMAKAFSTGDEIDESQMLELAAASGALTAPDALPIVLYPCSKEQTGHVRVGEGNIAWTCAPLDSPASLAEAAAIAGAAVQAVSQGLGQVSDSINEYTEDGAGLTRLASDDATLAGTRDYCAWLTGGAEGAECRKLLGLPPMGTGIDMGDMKMEFTPPSNTHAALNGKLLICIEMFGVCIDMFGPRTTCKDVRFCIENVGGY